ncbi:MAG: xanthine dehydrogenase family protein subunit M [Candidatus Hadarchaeota archaeon]
MPLPEFDYMQPRSIGDLMSILSKHGDAKLMAGGTDLLVLMRDRIIRPGLVVDVKKIEELHELSWDERSGITIGAAVTVNELLASEIIREKYRALWDAASELADPTLRNRATLAGNICNASPAADSAPALLVHGADVVVMSARGSRIIPIEEFFKGVKKTALAPGEFVKCINIANPGTARSAYMKWKRTWGEDLALVGVAALVGDSGVVRLAYSSAGPTPILLELRDVFDGVGPLEEKIEKASKNVPGGICPINDVRCAAEYRTHIATVLTKRVLRKLMGVGT